MLGTTLCSTYIESMCYVNRYLSMYTLVFVYVSHNFISMCRIPSERSAVYGEKGHIVNGTICAITSKWDWNSEMKLCKEEKSTRTHSVDNEEC